MAYFEKHCFRCTGAGNEEYKKVIGIIDKRFETQTRYSGVFDDFSYGVIRTRGSITSNLTNIGYSGDNKM